MSDWRDIETAPKDGTRVLLGRFAPKCRHKKHGFMAVDFWHDNPEHWSFTGWGKFNTQSWPATHWMPLPNPPPSS